MLSSYLYVSRISKVSVSLSSLLSSSFPLFLYCFVIFLRHCVANCCSLRPSLSSLCRRDSPYLKTLPTTAFRRSILTLFAISGPAAIRFVQSCHVSPFPSRFITAICVGLLRLISCPTKFPFIWEFNSLILPGGAFLEFSGCFYFLLQGL